MQRLGLALLACLCCLFALAACGEQEKVYQDGVYSAEFKTYDSYGYKDFMTLTVQGGKVTELVYDARHEDDGSYRTSDEKYQKDMEAVRDTYPKKYTADLVNQLLTEQDIGKVDAIAGATWSSDSFKALYTALEAQMEEGNTAPLLVDNVPEK